MSDATPPFRFPPWRHQAEEFERHRDDEARALLWQMRTGKTKAIIDLACYHFDWTLGIDGLLILAPNGVHLNWIRKELPAHAWPGVAWKGIAWDSEVVERLWFRQKLEDVLSYRDGMPVLAINSETLTAPKARQAIKRLLRKRRIMLVVDESDDFRTPGSARTKLCRGLAKKCRIRRILTGTVSDNSPLATFSQFEILEPKALGFSRFGDFKGHFASFVSARTKGGRSYEKLEGYRNLDELRERMAKWSSVVLREDVDDMPDLVPVTRTVPVTAEQKKAYEALRQELLLKLEDGTEVEAVDAQHIKLQQVLGGFVIDELGGVHSIVPPEKLPRLDVLMRELSDTPKSVIWCQFKEDIRRVVWRLEQEGLKAVQYHGDVSSADRVAALEALAREERIHLVGQPQAGGRGLTMPADTIIWYSHTPDLIWRRQATERATIVGGKAIHVVDLEVPGSRDTQILRALEDKEERAEGLSRTGLRDLLTKTLEGCALGKQ